MIDVVMTHDFHDLIHTGRAARLLQFARKHKHRMHTAVIRTGAREVWMHVSEAQQKQRLKIVPVLGHVSCDLIHCRSAVGHSKLVVRSKPLLIERPIWCVSQDGLDLGSAV